MSSPAYYREEARRCRDLAANTHDTAMAERWRAIAREYDHLADAMAGAPIRLHPSAVPQPQPMQQQQSKTKDDN